MSYKNNVLNLIASTVGVDDTSITITGASTPLNNPPSDGGTLTIADNANEPSKIEIITYTGLTDNLDGSFTITGCTRGQESTTKKAWAVNNVVYQSLTAKNMQDFEDEVGAVNAYLDTITRPVDANTIITLPNTNASFIPSEPDDNPDWVFRKEWTSYYNETRTTGKFLGTKTNLADALTDPNAAIGAYYQKSGAVNFYEITSTSGAGTEAETFRAGSKHFPQKPAFTVSADKVVVWDLSGTEPTMWAVYLGGQQRVVFTGTTPELVDVTYKNGVLSLATNSTNGGLSILDFTRDEGYVLVNNGNEYNRQKLADSNSATGGAFVTGSGHALVGRNVQCVLATITDDAPVDSDGLRDVTIYVGTTEGLSRIHNVRSDNSISDWTDTSGSNVDYVFGVCRVEDEILAAINTDFSGRAIITFGVNEPLVAGSYVALRDYIANSDVSSSTNINPNPAVNASTIKSFAFSRNGIIRGASDGTALVIHNQDDPTKSLNSKITGTFNTGYGAGNDTSVYACDDVSSSISGVDALVDYHNAQRDMDVVGTLTRTVSPGGDIYGLDGFSTSNYAEGDVVTDPDIKTGATFSCVISTDSLTTNDSYIGNYDGGTGSATGFHFYTDTSGVLKLQVHDNTNTVYTLTGPTLKTGRLVHIAATLIDGEQILYENGVAVANAAHTQAVPADPVRIGAILWNTAVDNVSANPIFLTKAIDRVLTPDEVKAMAEDDLRLLNEGGLLTGTGTNVITAYSKKADLTAACNGSVVDILKGNAVIRSISPGIGTLTDASFNDDWLIVSSATGIYTEMVGTPYVPVIGETIASRTLFYTGDTTTTDFYSDKKPDQVFEDGALQRPGSAEDYVLTHNGFKWITRFAVAPAAVDVAIKETE